MENILIFEKDSNPITTSWLIAEKFGKLHKNVIRDIENLECIEEFGHLNFEPIFYIDQWNRQQRE